MYPGFFAATTPDKPAVIMAARASRHLRELDERSMRLAQLLYGRGLRAGDKIAILAENHSATSRSTGRRRSGLYVTASTGT